MDDEVSWAWCAGCVCLCLFVCVCVFVCVRVCNLSQLNKSDNLPDVVLWNIGAKNAAALADVEVLSLLALLVQKYKY